MTRFEFYTTSDGKRKCIVSFGGFGEIALTVKAWRELCRALLSAIDCDEAENENR